MHDAASKVCGKVISFYTPPLRFDLPALKDGVAMVLEAVTGSAKNCGRDVYLKPFWFHMCVFVCVWWVSENFMSVCDFKNDTLHPSNPPFKHILISELDVTALSAAVKKPNSPSDWRVIHIPSYTLTRLSPSVSSSSVNFPSPASIHL